MDGRWVQPCHVFCLNHYAHSADMYGHCMLDFKMVYGWVLDCIYLVLCWTYRMHDFFLHIDSGTTWALSTTWCGTMRKHRSISSLRSKWPDMMSRTRTIFGIWALLLGLRGEHCSQKQNVGEMVEQWGTICYLEKSLGRGDESAKEWGLQGNPLKWCGKQCWLNQISVIKKATAVLCSRFRVWNDQIQLFSQTKCLVRVSPIPLANGPLRRLTRLENNMVT